MKRPLLWSVCVVLLSACATSPPVDQAVELLAGPAPTRGATRMEDALRCLAEHYPRNVDLRLSVNDLTDGTGATMDNNTLAKVLTQRPDVMLTIGLAKTGVRLVNRSSTGVAEWELKQAMQRIIGDGRAAIDPNNKKPVPFRPVMAGAMLGSTHYISGALTELNWNVQSSVNEFGIGGLVLGARTYRISMAVDLIVTNSRTTEIVIARSFSKQLVGQEYAANMFRFFDVGSRGRNWGPNEVFEFNLGKEANEPVQTGVRWMLETAAYDIVNELAGMGGVCDQRLPQGSRPAAPAAEAAVQTFPVAATPPAATPSAAATRRASNAILGINLFDDEGGIILRLDTRQPLDRLPATSQTGADKLSFDFEGVANDIGQPGQPRVSGIKGLALTPIPGGTRMTLDLSEAHRLSMVKESKALLIRLSRELSAAPQLLDTQASGSAEGKAGTTTPAESSTLGQGSSSVGASSSADLAPHKTAAEPSAEELIQILRH